MGCASDNIEKLLGIGELLETNLMTEDALEVMLEVKCEIEICGECVDFTGND